MQKVINYTSLELVELTDAYNVIEKNARVIILTWVLQWNLVYNGQRGDIQYHSVSINRALRKNGTDTCFIGMKTKVDNFTRKVCLIFFNVTAASPILNKPFDLLILVSR